jgi:hypothetical protein
VPKRRYDWDDWLSKRKFTLRRGVHYDCTQSSIVQQVRNAATARGVAVRPSDEGDRVVVFVERKGGADAAGA